MRTKKRKCPLILYIQKRGVGTCTSLSHTNPCLAIQVPQCAGTWDYLGIQKCFCPKNRFEEMRGQSIDQTINAHLQQRNTVRLDLKPAGHSLYAELEKSTGRQLRPGPRRPLARGRAWPLPDLTPEGPGRGRGPHTTRATINGKVVVQVRTAGGALTSGDGRTGRRAAEQETETCGGREVQGDEMGLLPGCHRCCRRLSGARTGEEAEPQAGREEDFNLGGEEDKRRPEGKEGEGRKQLRALMRTNCCLKAERCMIGTRDPTVESGRAPDPVRRGWRRPTWAPVHRRACRLGLVLCVVAVGERICVHLSVVGGLASRKACKIEMTKSDLALTLTVA